MVSAEAWAQMNATLGRLDELDALLLERIYQRDMALPVAA